MPFRSTNPATGEVIAEWPAHGADEVEAALSASQAAFEGWSQVELEARLAPLEAAADLLRTRAVGIGHTITAEMGKPLAEAVGEVGKCAWLCEHLAHTARSLLAPREVITDAARSYVVYRPQGAVLAIMPWNFPFWQVVRHAVPGLAGGNVVLLKHAPTVQGTAERLLEVFADAGFPEHTIVNLRVEVEAIESVVADPRVRGITLTGSTRAGRSIAEVAGRHLKKSVLELGGSDPALVLADADLELAASQIASSRLLNAGQSCIAAKRFIVVDAVRDAFVDALLRRLDAAVVGNPLSPTTTVGPLAREDLRDNLHRQVTESVASGARCVRGGALPDGPGFFYPVTLLVDAEAGMPAFDEEIFGPVGVVVAARDEEHAIHLANQTAYGLGASVYTRDTARGEAIALERLDAGACFVNGLVKSDPRLPFGGVKSSGYGRELSTEGLLEFLNCKTVWVR